MNLFSQVYKVSIIGKNDIIAICVIVVLNVLLSLYEYLQGLIILDGFQAHKIINSQTSRPPTQTTTFSTWWQRVIPLTWTTDPFWKRDSTNNRWHSSRVSPAFVIWIPVCCGVYKSNVGCFIMVTNAFSTPCSDWYQSTSSFYQVDSEFFLIWIPTCPSLQKTQFQTEIFNSRCLSTHWNFHCWILKLGYPKIRFIISNLPD